MRRQLQQLQRSADGGFVIASHFVSPLYGASCPLKVMEQKQTPKTELKATDPHLPEGAPLNSPKSSTLMDDGGSTLESEPQCGGNIISKFHISVIID